MGDWCGMPPAAGLSQDECNRQSTYPCVGADANSGYTDGNGNMLYCCPGDTDCGPPRRRTRRMRRRRTRRMRRNPQADASDATSPCDIPPTTFLPLLGTRCSMNDEDDHGAWDLICTDDTCTKGDEKTRWATCPHCWRCSPVQSKDPPVANRAPI